MVFGGTATPPADCVRSDIEVQLILGHADIETSKHIYAHLLDGSQDSAAARVEQLREARRAS